MSYTRTNWQDGVSGNTPINATNLNNIEDGIEEALEKNIITVGITSDVSLTADGQKYAVPNKIITQVGDATKLYLSTNGLYIGSGISHVLISGMIHGHVGSSTSNSSYNMGISKNGTDIMLSMNSGTAANVNHTKAFPPKLIDVQQGDYFQFGYYGRSGDYIGSNVARTYMTIEVVD